VAELSTVLEQRPDPSAETHELLEDTQSLADRAAFALVPSAVTAMGEKQGAILRAEAPASVEERVAAEVRAAAGTDNRSFIKFPMH